MKAFLITITLVIYMTHCAPPRYQIGSGAKVPPPLMTTSPTLHNYIPERFGDQPQSLIKLGAINGENVSLIARSSNALEFDIDSLVADNTSIADFDVENLAVGFWKSLH